MSVSFAPDWRNRHGDVAFDTLVVTRMLWRAAPPVGPAARAERGLADARVRAVHTPHHRLAAASLRGTVMVVEIGGEDIEPAVCDLHLVGTPANPIVAAITVAAIIRREPE